MGARSTCTPATAVSAAALLALLVLVTSESGSLMGTVASESSSRWAGDASSQAGVADVAIVVLEGGESGGPRSRLRASSNTARNRFAIVTPTYPRHFEQNVRFLLALLRNCADCRGPGAPAIQFVLSYDKEIPLLRDRIEKHPILGPASRVHVLDASGGEGAGTPRDGRRFLDISILTLRTAFKAMGLTPIGVYMQRTTRNRRWFGKMTQLSVKKYVGSWFAFRKQAVDVVWWLDSEAYLWTPRFHLMKFLERKWRQPRLFWTRESSYKRPSEVTTVCPPNGTLGDPTQAFPGPRPHLFENSFYLIGKGLFEDWTAYVSRSWSGRPFVDVFLRHGQQESGRVVHIIESQMMVYVGLCLHATRLGRAPPGRHEHCQRYQVIETDNALREEFGTQLYAQYIAATHRQGQFEHMFRHYVDPRFKAGIAALAAKYNIGTWRLDAEHTTCAMFREILSAVARGDIRIAFQSNSDGTVGQYLNNATCRPQLPIRCGTGLENQTCSIVGGVA